MNCFTRKKTYSSIVGILSLLIWTFVVFRITYFNRISQPKPSINLNLFWCLKEAWTMKNSRCWYFIIGNMLMFLPFGIIVPLFFEYMRKLKNTIVAGFVVSLIIEMVQLISRRGLFELDDIYNNMVGLILGYGIYVLIVRIVDSYKVATYEKIIVVFVWFATVLFFSIAYYLGQPLFDGMIQKIINMRIFC